MQQFAGDSVRKTLEKLGMQEDESIESQMVAQRIRGVQQKIQKQVFGNSKAESAQEWLERNIPQ
jgi:preprotein translocase subunit SecA